jgi:hypothetical protein
MIIFVLQLKFGRRFNINKGSKGICNRKGRNVAKIFLYGPKYTQIPALHNFEAVMNLNRLYENILNWYHVEMARN